MALTTWTLQRLTPPTERPVSLEQAKLNLRVSAAEMPLDPEILRAIDMAADEWEQDTDSPAIQAQFMQARLGFPLAGMPIELSKRPIQSIDSIVYDDGEAEITVDPAEYALDKGRRQVYRKDGASWPSTATHNEAVQITYQAGYASSATVPRYVQEAVLLRVHMAFFKEDGDAAKAYDRLVLKHLATFHAS